MPLLVGNLPEWFHLLTADNAGIVYQDINSAQLRDGLLHQPVDLRGVGDIGRDSQCLSTKVTYFSGGLFDGLDAAGSNDNVGAFICQSESHCLAESGTAAGDDGYLIL